MRLSVSVACILAMLVPCAAFGQAAGAPPPAVPQPPAALTADHRVALRCAAVFAIVATGQRAGEQAALALPPLAVRGKQYFAQVGEAVVGQAGLTREAVRDLMVAEVASLQKGAQAGRQPDLAGEVAACLPRLDSAVPPLARPDLLQCTAILSLAYDEVHAREGLSPRARDLATLASVLSSREREALVASGIGTGEADRRLAEARTSMAAEAADERGGVEKYDIARCYELARPEAKSHY